MKRVGSILILLLMLSCDSDSFSDCIQRSGPIITVTLTQPPFHKIRVEKDVSLILTQGAEQQVLIKTGENLLDEIDVSVINGTLVITNHNDCNAIRDYGITRVYVTAPEITEVRNSSFNEVRGMGTLAFQNLTLVSNSTLGPEDISKGGDFIMEIDCEEFTVSANGQSVFYISGTTTRATLSFEDEWPRFEGGMLRINQLRIFQRSANVMIVYPLDELTGEIRGTGDVIALHRPPVIDVVEYFTGTLIIQD